MSGIVRTMKNRRTAARNERALQRVISTAGTTTMRDELIIMSQRAASGFAPMTKIVKAARARRERREQQRNTIQYAIAHAATASERTELITLAGEQGVFV